MKTEEKVPKPSYFKGILSILIIGTGYYISTLSLYFSFNRAALLTIFLVIWGTYWFFASFSTIVAKYLTNNKNILYRGTNIVSISNLVFRIRRNYKTFAAIAVLVATTITAFGTVSSMKFFVDKNYEIEIPYSFSYISNDSHLNERIKEIIAESQHDLILWESINYIDTNDFTVNYRMFEKNIAIMKYSDFERVTKNLKPERYEKLIKETKITQNEAIYVEKPGVIMSVSADHDTQSHKIGIGNFEFAIKDEIKTPLLGSAVSKPVVIVSDSVYTELSKSFQEYTLNGFNITSEDDSEDLGYQIVYQLPEDKKLFSFHGTTYYIYGILYFLGAFMSLVFVIATGSIIYFKLLSDALDDKEKYQMLKKIGMTNDEIIKSVSNQVSISFGAPLIVGSIHSIMAIRVLSRLMDYPLIVPTSFSIGVFTVVYGLFYFVTTKKYLQIVCEQ